MESAESRCRCCEDKRRCWREPSRLLSCLNFCLVVTAIIYVVVLHTEVVGLRTELGRCTGESGVSPISHTGNGHVDVRVLETDEVEEEELIYGNGHPPEKETTADVVTLGPRRDRPRRAVTVQEGRRRTAKKHKKRHRKKGIKGLHMEGNLQVTGVLSEDLKFRYWHAPAWTRMFSSMFKYDNETGETAVREPGLYFIYSQITLSTDQLRSGYSVYVDDVPRFTCVNHRPLDTSNEFLTNTCSMSGLVVLHRRQRISIGVESDDLRALMKPKLSFWGMIKLANSKSLFE